MKTFILLLLMFFPFNSFLFSQNLLVTYERQLNFSRRNYILFINDTLSYWQYVKHLKDIDTTLSLNGASFHSFNAYHIVSPEYEAYPYKNFILKDKKHKKLYFVDSTTPDEKGNWSYVTDSLFPMKWEPWPDHVFLLGYICKSAKTNFRGRTYIAYYTPELPYNDGPWKFGGLPGLILKVEDTSGEFKWTATKIIKNYPHTPDMPDLSKYHFISWPEYVKRARKYRDKKLQAIKAKLMREGDHNMHHVRIISEEIIHPIYSFEGVSYGEMPAKKQDSSSVIISRGK